MDLWVKLGGHQASVLEGLGGSGGAEAGGNKSWRIQKLFFSIVVTFVCFEEKSESGDQIAPTFTFKHTKVTTMGKNNFWILQLLFPPASAPPLPPSPSNTEA